MKQRPLQLGVWCKTPHPSHADVLASSGVDYLIADQQHGAIASSDLLSVAQVAQSWGCSTFTRVAVGDYVAIQRAIDVGVAAVIVPGIDDETEAAHVAGLFDYPPAGRRSRGVTRVNFAADGEGLISQRPRFLPLIETKEAVERIDAILGTTGVDGVYIGPVDLGISLGVGARNFDAPALADALATVESACRNRGMLLGTGAETADEAVTRMAAGYHYITVGTDWALLRKAISSQVDILRTAAQGAE